MSGLADRVRKGKEKVALTAQKISVDGIVRHSDAAVSDKVINWRITNHGRQTIIIF
jgi:hypothetical protein